jgi:hypothetical protein
MMIWAATFSSPRRTQTTFAVAGELTAMIIGSASAGSATTSGMAR